LPIWRPRLPSLLQLLGDTAMKDSKARRLGNLNTFAKLAMMIRSGGTIRDVSREIGCSERDLVHWIENVSRQQSSIARKAGSFHHRELAPSSPNMISPDVEVSLAVWISGIM
jgi:hypothetical protein